MNSNATDTSAVASVLVDTWIGIDVSKNTLDACLIRSAGKPHTKAFANTPEGWAKLLRWAAHLGAGGGCQFGIEPTNTYHTELALFLVEAGQRVSLLNSYRVKHARLASGDLNKTDPADAKGIAEYCRKENPPLWRAAAPEVRTLVALLRRLHSVEQMLYQETNRRDLPGHPLEVVASLEQSIAFLQAEILRLQEQISKHIDQHPNLRADKELLLSIPGISDTTAHALLAELPDVSQFASAQSAAAFVGLCPREYRSGTSVKKQSHLSKRGNRHLRKALYLPAMSAIRFNPCVKALYERLVASGKARRSALAAAMRKLLMLAYGVLKHRQKFDPEWREKSKKQITSPA